MVARTALDANVFRDSSLAPRDAILATESLLRRLRKHGWLCTRQSRSELIGLARSITVPRIRELWCSELMRLPLREVPQACAPVGEIDDFGLMDDAWSPHVQLAIVEDELAELLGLGDDALSLVSETTGLEVVPLKCSADARRYVALAELAERPIRADEDREAVWLERLEPLAAMARRATICCRYSGSELVQRRGRQTGLMWLLQKFNGTGPEEVSILTACGQLDRDGSPVDSDSIESAFRQLGQALDAGCLKQVKVGLLPDRVFSREGHDRFVRFRPPGNDALHHVVELSRGLVLFANSTPGQESVFQYRVENVVPERETRLRDHQPTWFDML